MQDKESMKYNVASHCAQMQRMASVYTTSESKLWMNSWTCLIDLRGEPSWGMKASREVAWPGRPGGDWFAVFQYWAASPWAPTEHASCNWATINWPIYSFGELRSHVCEVAPARGIPFREGSPDFRQCLSAYIMQIKGIPQWRHGSCKLEVSERLLTFPWRNVVLGKCGQSECHGAIDKCDLVRVSHMMLLSRTARWNLRKRGAEQTQYPWHFRPANQLTADRKRKLSRFVTRRYLAAEQFQDQVMV